MGRRRTTAKSKVYGISKPKPSTNSVLKNISKKSINAPPTVIVVQNIRESGNVLPVAFDLTQKLGKTFAFQGEKIWLQNQKTLRPYGYPYAFVPNVHHHYCLIFKVKH